MRGARWVGGGIALAALAALGYGWSRDPRAPRPQPVAAIATTGKQYESTHYVVTSTATAQQTQSVLAAAEALRTAYAQSFDIKDEPGRGKYRLVLYGSRAEFRSHNRSSTWAEAYYLAPTCYAYYAEGAANPYHWMMHEATHQLNHELAGLRPAKWVNEGLASYFGASRLQDGRLDVGSADTNAYPIWWLGDLNLSGDVQADIRDGRIVALRHLIASDDRADINRRFNAYYIGYWSLTHFLFHHEDGKYAAAFRALIRDGGTLADFERRIGPVDTIQAEWYEHLLTAAAGDEPIQVESVAPAGTRAGAG